MLYFDFLEKKKIFFAGEKVDFSKIIHFFFLAQYIINFNIFMWMAAVASISNDYKRIQRKLYSS